MKTFIIINPEAAGGLRWHRWPRVSDRIFQHLGLFEYEFTNARGSATLLAAQAVSRGYERIIAVGGDGTVNEVLNGLFDADGRCVNPDIVLGCLPAGSGTDFWKSCGVSGNFTESLVRIASGAPRWCDVGRVELQSHTGHPLIRYFCNMADVGIGGMVVDRAKRLPRFTHGTLGYIIATLTSLARWTPETMDVLLDGQPTPSEPLLITLIANGAYCGGGMCVAPEARCNDGLFHVVRIKPFGVAHLARLLPQVYTARLHDDAVLTTTTARDVTITTPHPLQVTLDGEVPGLTTARFTILPKALRVVV